MSKKLSFKEQVLDRTRKSRSLTAKDITNKIPFEQEFSPKLSKTINSIKQGQYIVVGGRESSGKRSFVHLFYVLHILDYYLSFSGDSKTKPKIKILYYNMRKSEHIKAQKLLCTYLWKNHSILMDIPTLNGDNGKMYDLDSETEDAIEAGVQYFDYFVGNGMLEIITEHTNPTGIRNDIHRYMTSIGGIDRDEYGRETFIPDKGFENQITIVIVDDIKRLKNETREDIYFNENQLYSKLDEYIKDAVELFNITAVLIVPSFDTSYKPLNQMVPEFREVKYFYDNANIVYIMFNPYRFGIIQYHGYDTSQFKCEDHVQRFRSCTVLKNADGLDGVVIPFGFFPENGILFDLPRVEETKQLNEYISYLSTFKRKYIDERSR